MANPKFISYTNAPVFLATSEGSTPATGASFGNFLAANSCEINFDASLEPVRHVGRQPISDDFFVNGPKNSKIAVSYIPLVGSNTLSGVQEASLAPFSMTGDFVSGHQMRVGNFLFKRCYLDSLGVQIVPNNPIRVTANFTSYDTTDLEGTSFTGSPNFGGAIINASSGASVSCLHALAMNASGQSVSLPESKTDISIQYNMTRQPVYEVGEEIPRTVILNTVERTTSLNGENVGEIISMSGNQATLNLRMGEFGTLLNGGFNPTTDTKLFIGITGKLFGQNISAQPGRSVEGSVQIREVIL